jgi:hypothetical protein
MADIAVCTVCGNDLREVQGGYFCARCGVKVRDLDPLEAVEANAPQEPIVIPQEPKRGVVAGNTDRSSGTYRAITWKADDGILDSISAALDEGLDVTEVTVVWNDRKVEMTIDEFKERVGL